MICLHVNHQTKVVKSIFRGQEVLVEVIDVFSTLIQVGDKIVCTNCNNTVKD